MKVNVSLVSNVELIKNLYDKFLLLLEAEHIFF